MLIWIVRKDLRKKYMSGQLFLMDYCGSSTSSCKTGFNFLVKTTFFTSMRENWMELLIYLSDSDLLPQFFPSRPFMVHLALQVRFSSHFCPPVAGLKKDESSDAGSCHELLPMVRILWKHRCCLSGTKLCGAGKQRTMNTGRILIWVEEWSSKKQRKPYTVSGNQSERWPGPVAEEKEDIVDLSAAVSPSQAPKQAPSWFLVLNGARFKVCFLHNIESRNSVEEHKGIFGEYI